jgi:hypothetical protein
MAGEVVVTAWVCKPCEVGGTDQLADPACWNCGGSVFVAARTTHPKIFHGMPAAFPDIPRHTRRR